MKKYILVFILGFIIGYGAWAYQPARFFLTGGGRPVIHVFYETYATNPALTQMVEFAKLPKDTKKIIAWHRFPKRRDIIDLSEYNATEADIIAKEGYYGRNTKIMLAYIKKVAEENPKASFVFHANFSHMPVSLFPILKELPSYKIKRIHLYEDGYGELFKRPTIYYNTAGLSDKEIIKNIKDVIAGRGQWNDIYTLKVHKLYPVTYHFLGVNYFDKYEQLKPVLSMLKDMDIENINFDLYRRTLTEEQKQVVMRLAGFDYETFAPLMKNKKTVVFTMGLHFKNMKRYNAEQNFLRQLKSNQLDAMKNAEEYVWFYKPHPSFTTKDFREEMKKNFPDMIEIPAQIPYEVLILAGLKPTKTAGFGSSLYYSLNADDVLVYLRRLRDTYLPFLIEVGKLRPEQVLNLNKF